MKNQWTDYIAELCGDQPRDLELSRSPLLHELDWDVLDASVRALPKDASRPLRVTACDDGFASAKLRWMPGMANPLRMLLQRLAIVEARDGTYDLLIDGSSGGETTGMSVVQAPSAQGFLVVGYLPPQFVSLLDPRDDETLVTSKWSLSRVVPPVNDESPEADRSTDDDVPQQVIALRAQGLTLGQLSQKFGIARRRVQTILDNEKKRVEAAERRTGS